jgi:hypothetical protein
MRTRRLACPVTSSRLLPIWETTASRRSSSTTGRAIAGTTISCWFRFRLRLHPHLPPPLFTIQGTSIRPSVTIATVQLECECTLEGVSHCKVGGLASERLVEYERRVCVIELSHPRMLVSEAPQGDPSKARAAGGGGRQHVVIYLALRHRAKMLAAVRR